MINIKNFDSSWPKMNNKTYKNIYIYYIWYITIKSISDYKSIYSVNPMVSEVDGYIGEKNENKYLVFASIDKNKKVS